MMTLVDGGLRLATLDRCCTCLIMQASYLFVRHFFKTSALTGGGGWQVEDHRQKEGLGETTVWRVSGIAHS